MSMCNVLAVLGDNDDAMWETFDEAVALAQAENARLTLAKTCDDGRSSVWVTPFAFSGAYVPPQFDTPEDAARVLAEVVDRVPASLPVTTVVLNPDTQGALLKLLSCNNYGAVVADCRLLRHCRRVRRALRSGEVREVAVTQPHTHDGGVPGGVALAH